MGFYTNIIKNGGGTIAERAVLLSENEITKIVAAREKLHNEGGYYTQLVGEEKKFTPNKPWTAWDRECEATYLVYDMCKALSKYTVSTDSLSSMTTRMSDRGNFAIDTVIIRDGELHNMLTEVIWAGGYNIKCLHTRYITKTTLPKNGQTSEEVEALKAEVKARKKMTRMDADMKSLKRRIDIYEERVADAKLKTDEEITAIVLAEKDNSYLTITWERLSEYGQANYKTKEAFEAHQLESIANNVERWKSFNIFFPTRSAESMTKNYNKDMKKFIELSTSAGL